MTISAVGAELVNNGKISEDSLYNTLEVSKYLNIARNTLSVYILDGRIKACRHGKKWMIKGKDLKELVDNMEYNVKGA